MILPENILFTIVDADEIGMISVIFTPIDIFNKIKGISQFTSYTDLSDILSELNLEKKLNFEYLYQGTLDRYQLHNTLIERGFSESKEFTSVVNKVYIHEYSPKDIDELRQLGW